MLVGRLDLSVGRWVPFVQTMMLKGVNLTGADFRMQVRAYRDAPGYPLIDFGAVATAMEQGIRVTYAGLATVDEHIAAGRMDAVSEGSLGTDQLALTLLTIRIFEGNISALPFPAERGDDAEFAWDMHVTPNGEHKQTWLAGKFIVLSGVTQ
jgi:hypothetical protein